MATTQRTKAGDPRAREGARADATELRVAISRLQRQLRSRVGGTLTPSQSSALVRLEQCGPMRLGALADAEGTSAAAMSKLVASLEERRLLARTADESDGRASLLTLNLAGRSMLDDLRSRGAEVLRVALDGLSVADRDAIRRATPALGRLSDRLLDVR